MRTPAPAHPFGLESLEDRRLMAITAPWGYWPNAIGLAKVVQTYPWLDGGGNGVAVVDKGIDYWHAALGGNRATGLKAPRIVNVYDYRDNDTDPFPNVSEKVDATSPHGTGVAGILAGVPYVTSDNLRYQGVLQNAKLYNLRTNSSDSQNTIKKALGWIAANAAKYKITAVNLTDFIGTGVTPVYAPEALALWNAGVFIDTPVANDWLNPRAPRGAIGYPAVSAQIFGIGGFMANGSMYTKTQRGQHLDLLGPAESVQLPYYVPSTNTDIWVRHGEGNSWATPYVTGAAVLVQQIDPTIKPADVMKILQDSGAFTPDPDAAYTGIAGYKRLNVYNAVNLAYSRRDDVYDQGAGGNDELARAKLIPLDATGKGAVSGLKLLIHDNDYFAFDVPAGGGTYNLKVGYTGSSPFPAARLLNSTGGFLTNVGGGAGLNRALTPGRYYLHQYIPNRSLVGTYSLGVAKVATTATVRPATAFSGVPVRAAAVTAGVSDLLVTRAPMRPVWSDAAVTE